METQEGHNLPVLHCIRGTEGWQICKELLPYTVDKPVIDKVTFGSMELGPMLQEMHEEDEIASITVVGLCTDICVISNAMILKATFPEVKIVVDGNCCAGVTVESHKTALDAMKAVQIQIID
jgi:nicotinamidase-related amidase